MRKNKTYVIKPHDDENDDYPRESWFLAGTIDMGDSYDWQHDMEKFLSNIAGLWLSKILNEDLYIYNPRRDKSDEFELSNKEELEYQINWELDRLESCDCIVMVLLPDSKSPISLLELGLFHDKITGVVCPKEFYRYDNVRIVCQRNNIPLYETIDEFKKDIRQLYAL